MAVPVVTIDGPGGAGKGTVASAIANALGWHLLDSGALYRIIAVAGVADGIALDDAQALVEMSEGLDIVFDDGQVRVNGANLTDAIRTEEAGNNASQVAALPPVRDAIFALQQGFRRAENLAVAQKLHPLPVAEPPLETRYCPPLRYEWHRSNSLHLHALDRHRRQYLTLRSSQRALEHHPEQCHPPRQRLR